MAWNNNERYGFNDSVNKNIGQINLNNKLGEYIYKYASNDELINFLEIGTWNGLGSTKCFIEGFKNRKSQFKFYSLECNTDKYEFAKKIYIKYSLYC